MRYRINNTRFLSLLNIIIALFFITQIYSQKAKKEYFRDGKLNAVAVGEKLINNEKQGKWVTYYTPWSTDSYENEIERTVDGEIAEGYHILEHTDYSEKIRKKFIKRKQYKKEQIKQKGIYILGKRDGVHHYYNTYGDIIAKGIYKKGKQLEYSFYKEGVLEWSDKLLDNSKTETTYYKADGSVEKSNIREGSNTYSPFVTYY